MIEFRWLVYCNENGLKSQPFLQYRNTWQPGDSGEDEWHDVETFEEKYNSKEDK